MYEEGSTETEGLEDGNTELEDRRCEGLAELEVRGLIEVLDDAGAGFRDEDGTGLRVGESSLDDFGEVLQSPYKD